MGSVQEYVERLHFGSKRLTLAEHEELDGFKINNDDELFKQLGNFNE